MICLNMELQINNNLGTMWTLLLVRSPFMHPLHMDIEVAFTVGLIITLITMNIFDLFVY